MGELAGKVAVVTGGSGGIGKATSELFAREGAKVVIADIDAAAGTQLANSIGPAALFVPTDVSDRHQIEALVSRTVEAFGRIDILFNNAGIACGAYPDFIDDRLDDFDRVMGVNLFGPMVGTQAAARVMKEQEGRGVILNNASIAGVLAGQAMMTYRASKAALIQFSKSAAIDLARYGIRVNCLLPGHIRTPLSSFDQGADTENVRQLSAAIDEIYLSNQPLKRRGVPEDVAEAALFLASDRARQITGVVLPVEGGVTIGDPVNHLGDIFAARARILGD